MKLTSPEFEDGAKLPEKAGYMQENANPELEIGEVPEEAESLALMLEDPDAQEMAGKTWLHWLTWNIPPYIETIGEDESPGVEGETDFPEKGYNGPNPPDGDHTLVFRLYALDKELELEEGGREEFEEAIKGHVIEEAELKGRWAMEHQTRNT
jgi:Raf kinase inhibitor-like YbhB/YbcL family protein